MTDTEATMVVRVLRGFFATDFARLDAATVSDVIRAYGEGLRDLGFEDVKAAIGRLARSAKFLPRVSEIREAVVTNRHGRARTGLEAWRDVRIAIRSRGRQGEWPGEDFEFVDPVVGQVVDALGWQELCDSENEIADRARFVELYDDLVRARREEAQLAPNAESTALPAAAPGTPLLPPGLARARGSR